MGLGISPDDYARANPGNPKPGATTQGYRPDGTYGTIVGNAPRVDPNIAAQLAHEANQAERDRQVGGKPQSGGASATFRPTSSGLFADGAQPFGGQTAGNRTSRFNTQRSKAGGSIPGSTF
tara:strand:- start:264 stop:626 length:363 start_codon:yes stop_codon:yes gene_type:complete